MRARDNISDLRSVQKLLAACAPKMARFYWVQHSQTQNVVEMVEEDFSVCRCSLCFMSSTHDQTNTSGLGCKVPL